MTSSIKPEPDVSGSVEGVTVSIEERARRIAEEQRDRAGRHVYVPGCGLVYVPLERDR